MQFGVIITTQSIKLYRHLIKQELSYGEQPTIDYLDGLSVNFPTWRFNIRASNTEPLIRLNVETVGDKPLLEQKVQALCDWIIAQGAIHADH